MITEVSGSTYGIDDADESYVYVRDDQPVLTLRTFTDAGTLALSWHGRTDLASLLKGLGPIARDVGSFASGVHEPPRSFSALYLARGDLFEFTHIPDPQTSDEEREDNKHQEFLAQNAADITFARYDAHSKVPVALWADLGGNGTDVGFLSEIVPDHVYTLFAQTQPTGFSKYEVNQLQGHLDEHLFVKRERA
jgi:hypothetical protein